MLVLCRDTVLFGLSTFLVFAACGGYNCEKNSALLFSFKSPDPTPGAESQCGCRVIIPANRNIVATDPNDPSPASLDRDTLKLFRLVARYSGLRKGLAGESLPLKRGMA
jgi:hypothetical protein